MGVMSVKTGSPPAQPSAPNGPAARRRAVFYVGLALIVVGVSLLGYVAWQLFGTNVVAHREQQRIVTDLQTSWSFPDASRSPTTAPEKERVHETPMGDAEALIRIPRFGKDYVMPVLHGIDEQSLARGYGHFPGSAGAGARGNYALSAHRITHGEPLRKMPELRPGDTVVVETRRAVYTYELDTDPEDLVVDFTQVWVVDPLPTNPAQGGVQPAQRKGQRLLTLTTCAELFHTDNRMVAFGHLVETEKKSR